MQVRKNPIAQVAKGCVCPVRSRKTQHIQIPAPARLRIRIRSKNKNQTHPSAKSLDAKVLKNMMTVPQFQLLREEEKQTEDENRKVAKVGCRDDEARRKSN